VAHSIATASCARADGAFPRAMFSFQSTHPLPGSPGPAAPPDTKCASPGVQVLGFRSWGSRSLASASAPPRPCTWRVARLTSRTASSGPCANGALGCSLWCWPRSSGRDAEQRSRSCA
jgi:hypothetical protein